MQFLNLFTTTISKNGKPHTHVGHLRHRFIFFRGEVSGEEESAFSGTAFARCSSTEINPVFAAMSQRYAAELRPMAPKAWPA